MNAIAIGLLLLLLRLQGYQYELLIKEIIDSIYKFALDVKSKEKYYLKSIYRLTDVKKKLTRFHIFSHYK